jgi:hypothetical protein
MWACDRAFSKLSTVGVQVFELPSKTRQPKLYQAVCLLYRLGWDSTPAIWSEERFERESEGQAWPARTVIEFARRQGISRRTLASAKKLCLVEDRRLGWGRGSEVVWLPPVRIFVQWVPADEYLKRLASALEPAERARRRKLTPAQRAWRSSQRRWRLKARPVVLSFWWRS